MSTTSYISTLLAIRYKYDFNPKETRYFCPTYFLPSVEHVCIKKIQYA